MAEKITLKISPAGAKFVRPGTPLEVRFSGCSAAREMVTADRLMLLLCLSKDPESAVSRLAITNLENLPTEVITEYVDSADPNPLVLDALRFFCINHPDATLHTNPLCLSDEDIQDKLPEDVNLEVVPDEEDPVSTDGEQFLSKYKSAQLMEISEKIKMALSGDKEWRAILVKDSNRLVSTSVLKNPRITDEEVLALIKSGSLTDEIMRLICANKEWVKIYKIRKALIENSRTPVQNAMRYMGTMDEKDMASFAKSKNVSSVISSTAKRILFNKKK